MQTARTVLGLGLLVVGVGWAWWLVADRRRPLNRRRWRTPDQRTLMWMSAVSNTMLGLALLLWGLQD